MALCIAGAAFAFDNDIDVNFSIPMSYDKWTYTDPFGLSTTTHKDFTTGYGFDICDTAMFTKMVGAKVNAGFYWPNKIDSTVITTIGNTTNTSNSSASITDTFVFNGFAGLAIKLYNTKSFSFLLAPGANFKFTNYNENTTFDFGLGSDIIAKFMITRDLYATASCPLIWNISETYNGETNENFDGYFAFTPKLGLGYRF